MITFVYAAVVAALAGAVLVLGFATNRKPWVLYALLIPCFTGSPIITFSRGAAGAVTASDMLGVLLWGCMIVGLHRRWFVAQTPAWYTPAKVFFALGVLGVVFVAPWYSWSAFGTSTIVSDRASGVSELPLPLLMAAYRIFKLASLASYVYFFCHLRIDRKDLNTIYLATILVCCICAVGIILTRLGVANLGLSTAFTEYQGASVFGLNRAPLARLILLGCVLSVARTYRMYRPGTLSALALLATALAFTGSRGGALALSVTVLGLCLHGRVAGMLRGMAVFVVCVAVGALLLSLERSTPLDRILETVQSEKVVRVGGRLEVWSETITRIGQNPQILLTGVGPFNFHYAALTRSAHEHAHNDYLNCLAEMGLIGVVVFILTLWYVYVSLRRSRLVLRHWDWWAGTCVLSAFYGLAAASIFEPTFYWSNAGLPAYRILLVVFAATCGCFAQAARTRRTLGAASTRRSGEVAAL